MKIILSILLVILLFALTACSTPANVATLQNLDEEATARIKADTEIKKQVESINPELFETKVDAQTANEALSARLSIIENAPVVDYDAKIAVLQRVQDAKLADLERRNGELKAALDAHLAIPTPTPAATPVVTGKLTTELVKRTDYVSSVEAGIEQNVDFTIKLVNSTGVDLTDIRLTCLIICNHDLFVEDEPTIVDLSNNSLIYDIVDWEDAAYIEFDFTRSTGCPYVYLDKGQSLIIKPVLRFISEDDDSHRFTFTIQVTDLSWEVK